LLFEYRHSNYVGIASLFTSPTFNLPHHFTFLSGYINIIYIFIISLGALGLIRGLFDKNIRFISIYIFSYVLLSLFFITSVDYGLQYISFFIIFAIYLTTKVFISNQGTDETETKIETENNT